jgi:hypothetical protein
MEIQKAMMNTRVRLTFMKESGWDAAYWRKEKIKCHLLVSSSQQEEVCLDRQQNFLIVKGIIKYHLLISSRGEALDRQQNPIVKVNQLFQPLFR